MQVKHRKYLSGLFGFFLCIIHYQGISQFGVHPFGFARNTTIVVKDINGDTLHLAWLGGLNGATFNALDINMDGIDDLLIFERFGNKILPLIRNNSSGMPKYTYMSEFRTAFPKGIKDWIFTQDFNHDGKKDLFTYTTGGIKVYENISEFGNPGFKLKFDILKSLQFGNYINIFLTNVDMPVIDDVDGDGDTDILTFGVLGSFVEWHRNMGVEQFGNPDTLVFERTERCWGGFMESESSNVVALHVDCPWSKIYSNKTAKQIEHVGSSLLFMDTNGDGLKDLLLGDVDFSNIIQLINGGTQDEALFVSQYADFPQNTKKIDIFTLPVISLYDVNGNGVKDMLVSPFDPSLYINDSKKSVWHYENLGTDENPTYAFAEDNFLQNEMIEHGSGAYPVLFDYNNDGLPDLFVANYGTRDSSWYELGYLYSNFRSTIALYKNTGSVSNPQFTLISEDFAGLSQYNLQSIYPTFADLDGDGDVDMLLGNKDGKIWFFRNTSGSPSQMTMQIAETSYFNINAGAFSTPQLFDIDKDEKKDLVIGNKAGRFVYYHNSGTATSPNFVHVTDTLGNITTADLNYSYYGHSVPCFFRTAENKTFLFSGSSSGNLLLFDHIDNNLYGTFSLRDTLFTVENTFKTQIQEGIYTAVSLANINNDMFPDMIVGNFAGGLSYFQGMQPPPDDVSIPNPVKEMPDIKIFPNPFSDEITIMSEKSWTEYIVRIEDLSGREVYSDKINQTTTIETIHLKQSIYVLTLRASKGNGTETGVVKKIIKIE